MTKLYDIEGERLTLPEIRARLPSNLKACTVRQRLWYGWRTWQALASPADYRPRPYQVRPSQQRQGESKPWRPAYLWVDETRLTL